MDRPTTRPVADARGSKPSPDEAFVLPSRRTALDFCRGATRSFPANPPSGPILLTGDAGVGKTWLWRSLEAESRPPCRWLAVDLTPANDPNDFYRLMAHGLGVVGPATYPTSASRVDLIDLLTERQANGERVVLVVEEAHNLSTDVWEEVRVLANRLDRPGGFAAMFLVGLTSLALRFTTRPFAAIEARLAARFHLGPIDVAEAGDLLGRVHPDRDWSEIEVETLHRDASGNPRRLLRRVETVPRTLLSPISDARKLEPAEPIARPISVAPPVSTLPAAVPLTGPDRPPIQADENMIEVGWSPEADAEADDSRFADSPGSTGASGSGEEAVQDHYAALQAWREWTSNQAPRVSGSPVEGDLEYEDDPDDEAELPSPPPPRSDRSNVRAEGEQKFAPFGQLFSRMAQPREPESP